jgi:hypothetical protein
VQRHSLGSCPMLAGARPEKYRETAFVRINITREYLETLLCNRCIHQAANREWICREWVCCGELHPFTGGTLAWLSGGGVTVGRLPCQRSRSTGRSGRMPLQALLSPSQWRGRMHGGSAQWREAPRGSRLQRGPHYKGRSYGLCYPHPWTRSMVTLSD